MTEEKRVVQQLRGVAAKLTRDAELQKDLLQEMLIHLARMERETCGHTRSWYIKSCEFHARNVLKHGRSIDSLKRARNLVSLGELSEDPNTHAVYVREAVDPLDAFGELTTRDIVQLVVPHLNETQRRVLFLLLKGLGVREIARQLGMTHPAVIKHRRKIAQVAGGFVREPVPI